MKKSITILMLSLLTFSCSENADESGSNNNNFNPPTWIHGTWLTSNSQGYKFKPNDFCQVTSSLQTICYDQTYSHVNDFSVYEEISNTRYFTRITIAGAEYNFEFIKISNDIIKLNNSNVSYERQ